MAVITRRRFLFHTGLAAGGLALASPKASIAVAGTVSQPGKAERIGRLQGVFNFMVTPFHANYDLDAEGLAGNIADHARRDTEEMTIVVGGGLGELFTLDPDEQRLLVEAAVSGAGGTMPVVAGAGGGYRNALRMARNAEAAGADAVLVFAYPFACDNAEGAYQYLKEVARSVEIDALIYCCGKGDFWPDVLRRLSELPNVIGFKDPSGGVEIGKALGPLIPDQLLWIAEGESHAEKALPEGARAYTTAVATFVPEACHAFWQAGVAQDLGRMQEIRTNRIDPVVEVRSVKPGYGISGIKVAQEALGRAGGPVRPPGTQVAEEDRSTIAKIAREHAEFRRLGSK